MFTFFWHEYVGVNPYNMFNRGLVSTCLQSGGGVGGKNNLDDGRD